MRAIWYAATACPVEAQATMFRVPVRTLATSANEAQPGSLRSSVRRTSSSRMSAFCTIRSASLPLIFAAWNPGSSLCTTNALTRLSSTSLANTTITSHHTALPPSATASRPLITQLPSLSRRAVVSSVTTSEP